MIVDHEWSTVLFKCDGSDYLGISSQNTAQQKQQQPKDSEQTKVLDGLQKLPEGEEAVSSKPIILDQFQMEPNILKARLVIPVTIPGIVGKLRRQTEIQTELEVNYFTLNFEELFKKTVYHIDCKFTPEIPKRLLRTALKEFVDKHYCGIYYAFDGIRNMYTTTELTGRSDMITVLNNETGKSISFTIVTSIHNQINMGVIKEYLKNGSSFCPPCEAPLALDIILKTFSLRNPKVILSIQHTMPIEMFIASSSNSTVFRIPTSATSSATISVPWEAAVKEGRRKKRYKREGQGPILIVTLMFPATKSGFLPAERKLTVAKATVEDACNLSRSFQANSPNYCVWYSVRPRCLAQRLALASAGFAGSLRMNGCFGTLCVSLAVILFFTVGSSLFPIERIRPVDLGNKTELWKEFFENNAIGWKPYLTVDETHKEFLKHQLLTTYIKRQLKCRLDTELDYISQHRLTKYIKGFKVVFQIPNKPDTKRIFRVHGLLDSAAKFESEIKKVTVLQFYKITQDYTIKYPNLPCLNVALNKKKAIPIELCTVKKGQSRNIKITKFPSVKFVKNAAQSPNEGRSNIKNDTKYNDEKVLNKFDIKVHKKLATIPARVLDQPSLAYFQNKEIIPKAGVWNADKFSKAVKLTEWIVINLDAQTSITSIKQFEKMLIRSGEQYNLMISPMKPVVTIALEKHAIHDYADVFRRFLNEAKEFVCRLEIVIVVIPDHPQGMYAIVKQVAELEVGILTQCIKATTLSELNQPILKNLLLKINTKLNGINHTLSENSCPSSMRDAIIFGVDISHPSQVKENIPSIAAVAASHDLFGIQYNVEWRLLKPNEEIIHDLENIVHKQLLMYMDKNGIPPKKILYYRDGVGNGQLPELLNYEMIAIRRACLRLNMKYQPPITFLVLQKRNGTSMFPIHPIDKNGKSQSFPSGTIVHTQITHPTKADFYLCSQDTSRPTGYHLIWDDSNFSEDELEQLTFYLCFVLARCTRSISRPTPTYYAHLAANRARVYIENKYINLKNLEEEQKKIQLNDLLSIETPMFFT
ncbi:Piwi domain,Ribonuclease H-like domain,PAZ domain,Protein argonaute, N-terminal [Cinara cedri]|uniref:Piwi domain,Ribonuclease H-like domain,PAZ domain,Protein argonaute, N-terminal n=1 Tax=Cinara cedri TaxID=506608 RepID=A0A5E4MQP0_9HEMI|nr:Piwi domain,Ribonuclease H-like domain,PAZ domain,Protein argonaute, N-terminal [Cinara cedri]